MPEMEVFKNLIRQSVIDCKAKIAVELGVGKGESTGIILDALQETGGELYSYDIVDSCFSLLINHRPWHFSDKGGAAGFEQWDKGDIDFLFVDTDPHGYDQAYLWCLTWFRLLKAGGISLWHDTNLNRPGVDVRGALECYTHYHQDGGLTFIDTSYGMGVMVRL